MIVGIEAIAEMSRTERLTRRTLQLLANSAVGAPKAGDDVALWMAGVTGLWRLSPGELAIWHLANDIYTGEGTIAALGRLLDDFNRAAVAAIITDWLTT